LIDTQLSSGTKSGYKFTLSGVTGTPASTYQAIATPLTVNQSGVRYFCSFADAVVRLQPRCNRHLRHHLEPAAVSLDLAKYLGEGTSRKEAEEKSSAFFIVGRFSRTAGFQAWQSSDTKCHFRWGGIGKAANEESGRRIALHSQGLTIRLEGPSPACKVQESRWDLIGCGRLIIAAVAVPSFLRSRMAANESAAAASIRTLNSAQISYNSAYPTVGYASTLGALGGTSCTPPSATSGCLIDTVLAGGQRTGYNFTLTNVSGTPNSSYNFIASPIVYNYSGMRYFCSNSDAVVRVSMTTIATCDDTISPQQ
jgi:hypothetical protein